MANPKGRDFWGPPTWTTLHSFAAAYKPENAEALDQLIAVLPLLLPCDECGEHLESNLARYPVKRYMRNNHDLFFWTYLLHDAVNQQITRTPGRSPKYSPPFDTVKAIYFRALSSECQTCSTLL